MYLFLNLELWFKKIFLDNSGIGKLVVINNSNNIICWVLFTQY
jgi:hypothetical protein